MRSRVAAETSMRQRARVAAMSPAARVELAMRLGEQGLAAYMATHQVDRATALIRIAATRSLGRRRSRAAGDD